MLNYKSPTSANYIIPRALFDKKHLSTREKLFAVSHKCNLPLREHDVRSLSALSISRTRALRLVTALLIISSRTDEAINDVGLISSNDCQHGFPLRFGMDDPN